MTRPVALFGGRVVVLADLTADQRERLALEQRAESGIIPSELFGSLTLEARARLAPMSQSRAQRELAAAAPEPPRTMTPLIDEVVLEHLTARSRVP